MTKRKKVRAVVEAAAAAAAAAAPAAATAAATAAAPASDSGSSRIAPPAERYTVPVVDLLPESTQLGCLAGPETAQLARRSG